MLFFAGVTSNVHAQLPTPDTINQGSVNLQYSPQYPKPGQTVVFTVESYKLDLNRATISWLIDGQVVKSGTGLTRFETSAGKTNEPTTVSVAIQSDESSPIEKSITLNPAQVDVVWEANSYTPPFYKGKALYPFQGDIKVIALPNFTQNGVLVNPKNLIYTWRKDDFVATKGYGIDSIKVNTGVILRPIEISVTATNADGSITGTGSITISPQAPRTVFYEDNPIYGTLYNQAITGSLSLKKEEIRLRAVPFFFSRSTPYSTDTTFTWNINSGDNIPTQGSTVLLRRPDTPGQSQVSVTIKSANPKQIFQFTTSNLLINFN
jgi:hypothetical protein